MSRRHRDTISSKWAKETCRLADFFIRLAREKPLGTVSGIIILILILVQYLCRCLGSLCTY